LTIPPLLAINVTENSPLGTVLAYRPSAFDEDEAALMALGFTSRLEFTLTTVPPSTFLTMARDGTITVTGAINYELNQTFNAVLAVKDVGVPIGTMNTSLVVTVWNINEAPVWTACVVNGTVQRGCGVALQVSEGATAGTALAMAAGSLLTNAASFTVADEDIDSVTRSVDAALPFGFVTGILVLTRAVDFEVTPFFSFAVRETVSIAATCCRTVCCVMLPPLVSSFSPLPLHQRDNCRVACLNPTAGDGV
jgi:hypothetical protein